VTFTGTPAKMASSMAGTPAAVPGIFTYKLDRSASLWMLRAASMVDFVSSANSGDTSIDTQPSTPPVRSNTGRNRSAARLRSSSAKSTNSPSPLAPARAFLRMLSS